MKNENIFVYYSIKNDNLWAPLNKQQNPPPYESIVHKYIIFNFLHFCLSSIRKTNVYFMNYRINNESRVEIELIKNFFPTGKCLFTFSNHQNSLNEN
jgi:hypothetical protein